MDDCDLSTAHVNKWHMYCRELSGIHLNGRSTAHVSTVPLSIRLLDDDALGNAHSRCFDYCHCIGSKEHSTGRGFAYRDSQDVP